MCERKEKVLFNYLVYWQENSGKPILSYTWILYLSRILDPKKEKTKKYNKKNGVLIATLQIES